MPYTFLLTSRLPVTKRTFFPSLTAIFLSSVAFRDSDEKRIPRLSRPENIFFTAGINNISSITEKTNAKRSFELSWTMGSRLSGVPRSAAALPLMKIRVNGFMSSVTMSHFMIFLLSSSSYSREASRARPFQMRKNPIKSGSRSIT